MELNVNNLIFYQVIFFLLHHVTTFDYLFLTKLNKVDILSHVTDRITPSEESHVLYMLFNCSSTEFAGK